jgi:hypothetical protein
MLISNDISLRSILNFYHNRYKTVSSWWQIYWSQGMGSRLISIMILVTAMMSNNVSKQSWYCQVILRFVCYSYRNVVRDVENNFCSFFTVKKLKWKGHQKWTIALLTETYRRRLICKLVDLREESKQISVSICNTW